MSDIPIARQLERLLRAGNTDAEFAEALSLLVQAKDSLLFGSWQPRLRQAAGTQPQRGRALLEAFYAYDQEENAAGFVEAVATAASNPEIREAYATLLMAREKPYEAAKQLAHLQAFCPADKIPLLLDLAASYQEIGWHDEALTVLDSLAKQVPAADRDLRFRKLRGTSAKLQGTRTRTKALPPPKLDIFAHLRQGTFPLYRWVIGVGLALAAVFVSLVLYLEDSPPVPNDAPRRPGPQNQWLRLFLVNGSGRQRAYLVNGTLVRVPAHGHVELADRQATELHVRAADKDPPVPAAIEYAITLTPRQRAYDRKVIVINPDACAFLVREESCYRATDRRDLVLEPPLQYYPCKQVRVFDDIHFPFADFPDEIHVPQSTQAAYRRRLFQVLVPDTGFYATLAAKLGQQETSRAAQRRCEYDPGNAADADACRRYAPADTRDSR